MPYLKTNHEIDVVDGLVILEELNREEVCNEAIEWDDKRVKSQQPAMDAPVTVLLTDEALCALRK